MSAHAARLALVADVDALADALADLTKRARAERVPHLPALEMLDDARALIVRAGNRLDGAAEALR